MQKLVTFSFLLCLLYLHSCKKPATPGPAKFTGCRIKQISEVPADTVSTGAARTVYNFYYNDDGTVQHMYVFVPAQPYGSYYKYFTYKDGLIAIKTANAQSNYTQPGDSLTLDNQNRVSRILRGYYGYYSYSDPQTDSFFYDRAGQLYLHTLNNYGTFFSDTLTWQNGDVITKTRFQADYSVGIYDIYSFTYADTLYNTGNNTADLKDFENYGRSIYTNKHLLRQVYVQNANGYDSTKTYSYAVDAGGRITNITENVNGTAVNTTKVLYECQ